MREEDLSLVSDVDEDVSDVDSDRELQKAFGEGKLKPGLNRLNAVIPEPKKIINDVAGMQQKLQEIQQNLPWLERLDVTTEPVARLQTEDELNDDFKREMIFYRQAQAAVLLAIPRLQKLGIATKRPDDYFAEMAKPDQHMNKVRAKLLEKKQNMERSELAKKLRAAKKFGKKVQQEVALSKQREKKELADAVKKYRKGKANNLHQILEETGKPKQPNKKRQQKNRKFGFGGQKKRAKRNTKESMDSSWTKSKSNFKGKQKAMRPGKSKRRQIKQKRK